MDLLTVVEHEMGHVLGFAEDGNPAGIMGEVLAAGIRRVPILPSAIQSTAVRYNQFNQGVSWAAALTLSIAPSNVPASTGSVGTLCLGKGGRSVARDG